MKSDKEISALLKRYYEGETTLKEEEELRLWFSAGDVPQEMENEKRQFLSMVALAEESVLDSTFDDKVMNKMAASRFVSKKKTLFLTLSGIAAGLLILLAVWTGRALFTPKPLYGTVTNPTLAFAQTKVALQIVAKELNKGLKPAKKVTKTIAGTLEKTNNLHKIKKGFNELQQLKKVERATKLMQSFNSVYINLEKK